MSRESKIPLADELGFGLGRLESHVRTLQLVRGTGVVLAVASLGIASGLLIDWQFSPSAAVRIGLLLAVATAVMTATTLYLLRPWLRRFSRVELAAIVENAHPQLGERLTSTIELSDPEIPECDKGSPLMREFLVRQAIDSTAALDLTDSVAPDRSLRLFAFGAVGAVALILPLVIAPSAYGLLFSRFFVPWGNYDSLDNLFFQIENGDRVVARGRDVTIRAEPRWHLHAGEVSEPVWLTRIGSTGETDQWRMDIDESSGAFVATIGHVFHEFEYSVRSGRAQSRNYRVTVVDAPKISEFTLEIEPPAYTGRATSRHTGRLDGISVFEQSRLNFQLRFNKPMTAAQLEWFKRRGTSEKSDPISVSSQQQLQFDLAPDARSGELTMLATRGGPFAIRLRDEFGLENERTTSRSLRIIRDEAPRLQVTGGTTTQKVRPHDTIQVTSTASDDIGVEELELHYRILDGDEAVLSAEQSILGANHVAHEFRIDLAPLGLQPGAVLTYHLRAADGREVPGPNEVWSPQRVLIVDSDADPLDLEEIAQQQETLKKRLSEIRTQLLENRKQVAELHNHSLSAIEQQRPFEQNDKLLPLANEQQQAVRQLEQLADDFAENSLFEKLAESTRQVARGEVTAADTHTRAAAEEALEGKSQSLSESLNRLLVADEKLGEIERQFDALSGLERDLLELNRLAREARQLADEAQALDRRRKSVPADETAEQKAEREKKLDQDEEQLRKQQEALADRLKNLLERRPELVEAARQLQLDRLAELAKQASDLAVPQEMLAADLNQQRDQPEQNVAGEENLATPDAETQAARATAQQMQIAQQRATREAAQLAIDAARQQSPASPVAEKMLETVRQSNAATRHLLAGQLQQAAQKTKQSAATARTAAEELAKSNEADSANDSLEKRIGDFVERQDRLAEQLQQLSGSPQEQMQARIAGERQLAAATRRLTEALGEVGSRLSVEPLTLIEAGALAQGAERAGGQAAQSMQRTGGSLAAGRIGPAADSAREAGDLLRKAAKLAAAGVPEEQQRQSLVPGEIADRVAEAARRLEQARKQLAQGKSQEGKPGDPQGEQQADRQGEAKQSAANSGQNDQAGNRSDSRLARSSQQLRQAAQALNQAADTLQQGQQSKQAPDDSISKSEQGDRGTGTQATVDLSTLEIELEKLSKREWGRLPGKLQTEILQAAGKKPNSNYADLIRHYFREIAAEKPSTIPVKPKTK